MKIGIIGATGNAGSAIYQEAVQRGHEVTAIVRNEAKAKEQLGETVKTLTSKISAPVSRKKHSLVLHLRSRQFIQ